MSVRSSRVQRALLAATSSFIVFAACSSGEKAGNDSAAAKAADKSHPATRAAKAEAPAPRAGRKQRGRRDNAPEPVNEPMPFIDFVAAHPVGSTVQGVVERFASHGAYVLVDDCRCYLGLKSMGDP